MDRERLKEAIRESGYRQEHIAKKMGLSTYGLAKKINGANDFKVSEAASLAQLLGLSKTDAADIFFDLMLKI